MNSIITINDLPHELIFPILANLTPEELKITGRTCKLWKSVADEICRPPSVQQGLRGELSLKDLSCVVLSLVANRKDSKNDDVIIQLCEKAASDSRLEEDASEEKVLAIESMPVKSRMIIGIGFAMKFMPLFRDMLVKGIKIPICISKEEKKNPFAKFMVGIVENCQSHRKTKKLKQASKKGVAAASYVLCLTIRKEKAQTKQIELAANQGSSTACFMIANTYEDEQPDKSTEYLRKAAEAGHKDSQLQLGKQLIKTDKVEAAQWLGKAALNGAPIAQILLGELLAEKVDGAEEYLQELKNEGIDPIHVENGMFFKEHNASLTKKERSSYKQYKSFHNPIKSKKFLKKISDIKKAVEERLSKNV